MLTFTEKSPKAPGLYLIRYYRDEDDGQFPPSFGPVVHDQITEAVYVYRGDPRAGRKLVFESRLETLGVTTVDSFQGEWAGPIEFEPAPSRDDV